MNSRYAAEWNQVRDKLIKYTMRTFTPSSLESLFLPGRAYHSHVLSSPSPPPPPEDDAGRLDIIESTKIGTLRTPSQQPWPPRIPWLYHDSPGVSTSSGRGVQRLRTRRPGYRLSPRRREYTTSTRAGAQRADTGRAAGRKTRSFRQKNGPITSHGRGTWRVATWRRRRAASQKPTTSNMPATAFVYHQLIARLHCCVLLTLFGPIRPRNSPFSLANMINIYSKRLNRVAQDTWLFLIRQ